MRKEEISPNSPVKGYGLVVSWTSMRKLWPRPSRGRSWTDDLRATIGELEGLNRSTETDFLLITERLQVLAEAAKATSSSLEAITKLISGENGNSTCEALATALEFAREMEGRANAGSELAKVRNSLGGIRKSLSGFGRVGPSFQLMATLAQIETVHLGAAGEDLGHLSGEFRAAGEDIHSRVEYLLEGAAILQQRIDSALEEASASEDLTLKSLSPLIAAAESALSEFRTRQQQSAAGAAGLANQSTLLTKAIADIVSCVQFHDIARQQIEHVIGSLEELCDPSTRRGSTSRPSPEAAAVIDLQMAQLANTKASVLRAVREMDQSLETIDRQARAMMSESSRLLGPIDQGKESFYTQMEAGLQTIGGRIAVCGRLDHRARGAMVDLQRTLSSLQQSIAEIHAVELRVARLAINASISASHVGVHGEALEVVAAAMQSLRADSAAVSHQVENTIHSIADAVARAGGAPDEEEPANRHALFARLRLQMQELHSSNELAARRSHEMESIVSRLCADIEVLRKGFSAERLFTSVIEKCSETLDGIRAQTVMKELRGDALNGFGSRYTMQAEREVHEAVAAGPLQIRERTDPSVGSAELGDNVELF